MTSTPKMRFFIQPLTAFLRPVWTLGRRAQDYYAGWATIGASPKDIPARPGEPAPPARYRLPRSHPTITLDDATADLRFECASRQHISLLICLSADDYDTLRLRVLALGSSSARQYHPAHYHEFNYVMADNDILRLRHEDREAAMMKFVGAYLSTYAAVSRVDHECAYATAGDPREVSLTEAVSAIRFGYESPYTADEALQSLYAPSCGYPQTRRRALNARLTSVIRTASPTPQDYWGHKAWARQRGEGLAIGVDVTDLINRACGGDFIDASELVDIAERLETALGSDRADSAMQRIMSALTMHGCDYEDVVRANCGHWCADADTSLVYPCRQRWCPTCADEDARSPADLPHQLWDVNHLHLHDDDEYRTYEQEAEPDDDEDDVSGGRTSYSDPERLMSYSVNPLEFVAKDESFTPSPSGDLLMGVELEMILPGRQGKYIPGLRDQLGRAYAVFKADGSLDAFGAELVTAPRKLADHIERFTAVSFPAGSTAWGAGCCGMHVHIDSRGFTAMSLGKFVQFINDHANAELIRKIAGRHPGKDEQAQEYCQSIDQDLVVNPALAKGGYPNRYRMVNLTGLRSREADRLGVSGADGKYNTVELRIFRASLRKERLLAQLEFTHAAVMFCRVESYRNLKSARFLAYLTKNHFLYPNLAKWLRVVVPKPTAQRPEVRPMSVDTALDL